MEVRGLRFQTNPFEFNGGHNPSNFETRHSLAQHVFKWLIISAEDVVRSNIIIQDVIFNALFRIILWKTFGVKGILSIIQGTATLCTSRLLSGVLIIWKGFRGIFTFLFRLSESSAKYISRCFKKVPKCFIWPSTYHAYCPYWSVLVKSRQGVGFERSVSVKVLISQTMKKMTKGKRRKGYKINKEK